MARQVKRYEWVLVTTPMGRRMFTELEAENGNWVRWEDVAPILAESDRAATNRPSTPDCSQCMHFRTGDLDCEECSLFYESKFVRRA
jgi:hypothetical protein